MPYSIRHAQFDDWETIADYNLRLAWETESLQLPRERLEAGVRALLADSAKGRYFVACEERRIIGQLMHTREWSDWRNGDLWWLQSVYVHPDYRRQGVFRALFQHLERLAAEDSQVVGLRLYVEHGNARAQSTYVDLGIGKSPYLVMERIPIARS